MKAIALKNGQALNFITLDDMKGELLDKFAHKATGMDALLGKYLDTKKQFYKEGYAPIECYDVEKLRLIENVPM